MIRSRYIALPVAAAAALGLVTGANGDVTAAKLKHKASVKADPNGDLAFTKTKLTVKHGSVTITMTNPKSSGIDHGIAIASNGKNHKGKVVAPGKSSTVTVKLAKGTYSFFCPVAGHRAAGMKGKLVVK
jgi:uncharacterized cupredoxin-like copper-binding protein